MSSVFFGELSHASSSRVSLLGLEPIPAGPLALLCALARGGGVGRRVFCGVLGVWGVAGSRGGARLWSGSGVGAAHGMGWVWDFAGNSIHAGPFGASLPCLWPIPAAPFCASLPYGSGWWRRWVGCGGRARGERRTLRDRRVICSGPGKGRSGFVLSGRAWTGLPNRRFGGGHPVAMFAGLER